MGMISVPFVWASPQDQSQKTMQVLTHDFENQTVDVQKNVLRQLGLMQMQSSVGFLTKVALSSQRYSQDIRRDALKGLLALDSGHYRAVLPILQSEVIDEKALVDALSRISAYAYYLDGWVGSLDFQEPQWLVEAKMNHLFISVHKGSKLQKSWFLSWDKKQARTYLHKKIKAEKNNEPWKKMLGMLE